MKTSENLNELITALVAFQNEMPVLKKDSTVSMELKSGRKVQYEYIELGAIVQQSKATLAKNNLSIIQPRSTLDGKPALFTMLLHTSGQFIQTFTLLNLEGKTEQEKGSVITYNSRYDYVGMLRFGLLDEDDDGILASNREGNAAPPQKQVSKAQQIDALKARDVKPEEVGKHLDEVRKVQGTLEDPGQFVFPVGKFLGQKLSEMKLDDVIKNMDYWSDKKNKGSVPPAIIDFLNNGYDYLVIKGVYPKPYEGV